MKRKPFIIGIAGGSGSGKTTLAKFIKDKIKDQSISILSQDHYYIDQSNIFDGDGGKVNFDHPASLDFVLMAQHLKLLKDNQTVQVPIYNYATHKREQETDLFVPTDFIIVDGTLLFSQDVIIPVLDVKVMVETKEEVRFVRRLKRDTQERGRTPEGVYLQFTRQVQPMHKEFIDPYTYRSDLVICGEDSLEKQWESLLPFLP